MHRNDRLARLTAHAADCPECRSASLPLERIAAVLEAADPDVDPAALSRLTFARLQPELQHQAMVLGWRRVAIGVLLSLLPLPFVLAYNAYLLRLAYDFLSGVLPATIAAYLVLSYGAFLVLLFGTTYAAIPLLLVQRSIDQPPATA
jgi:hypothetical protein